MSKTRKIISVLLVFCFVFNLKVVSSKADNTGSLFTIGGIDINALIGAKDVWQMKDAKGNPIDGTGMVVAVLDTGVDYTHPDLGGGFGPKYKVIGGYDFRDGDSDPMDTDGHGTEDAGIIAANGKVVGVAPNAKILAYRTWQGHWNVFTQAVKDGANVIDADQYMGGFTPSYKVSTVDPIINKITNSGVPFVAGAGNFGSNFISYNNPSAGFTYYPLPQTQALTASGAITVAAYDVDQGTVTYYSSIGPSPDLLFKPDIMAPTNIDTIGLKGSYRNFNGTSASTPVVAGCVTLVKQAHPDWTSEEIKASLMNNAEIKYNPQNNEPITWLLQGAGLVKVYKAVTTPALITPYSTLMTPDNLKPITFTIKNVSDTTQTFSISSELTLGNFVYGNTDGISVSLSDNQITLNKGETKTVTATITVDKSKLEAGPYEGLVWFDNGSTKLHVPFIIWNAGDPIEWAKNLQTIIDIKASTNVLDFNDPNSNKITFDFTLGKGFTVTENSVYNYCSNIINNVKIDITDMNGNLVGTIYSDRNLLLGHYKFEWKPSGQTLQALISNGFKDGEYKYVISAIDKTSTVSGTFEVKNVPHTPNLTVDIPDNLTITKYSTDTDMTYTFTGKTDPGCTVTINNEPVAVDSDGNFKGTVSLSLGDNFITAIATNSAGIYTTVSKDVLLNILQVTVIKLVIGSSQFTVSGVSQTLDSPPIIKNGRTLLPIRAVVEALGGNVEWSPPDKKVTVSLGSVAIELWIGKSNAMVNGVEVPIDETNPKVVPEIINGRTMIPLRFVAENLGATVDWNQDTKTITITYEG